MSLTQLVVALLLVVVVVLVGGALLYLAKRHPSLAAPLNTAINGVLVMVTAGGVLVAVTALSRG
ncbi:hypothetical protein [Streptomyces candidus]|uniref:Uncharacterized protein n=1 Tax=Streptomyces candidus TaxID=67283 RepID=A0A7X0LTB8_9ACTN|nr:hypothetical protein [Streptomyces candidus]MBB6440175.1 hypothetical protein [Streptomyces candidus]GHH57653.1 hypothetical protein GCM10018773_65250 [Streptomyces candidus]